MSREFMVVVSLYVLVMFLLFTTLIVLIYVNQFSEFNTQWIESAIEKIISIIQLVVGAVVGALSTAIAYTFKKN